MDVLTTASGLHIDFLDDIAAVRPVCVFQQFSLKEETFVSNEITKLLHKGVISVSKHEINEFISPIFLVPKDDDSFRMILNLRALNENMPYIHFKMDTFASVVNLLRPGCFMCSVDIKDAYYTVPISQNHKKYLKFKFKGTLYNFNCLPNGLSSGPRKFTKLLKPALAYLRNRGFIIVAYIDDIMIIDESYEKCRMALIETIKLFDDLGFVINAQKSSFIPCKCLKYLGFCIDTEHMITYLPESKKTKIKASCISLIQCESPTIREVARVIGSIVTTFPAVKFGPLYYRALGNDKSSALKCSSGNFDAVMNLSLQSKNELSWWIQNIDKSQNDISLSNPDVLLKTDASGFGWGAVFNERKTHGFWSEKEKQLSINVLELKAVLFGLMSLIDGRDCHIKVLTDNMTAVFSINKMGTSHSFDCNKVVHEIWE